MHARLSTCPTTSTPSSSPIARLSFAVDGPINGREAIGNGSLLSGGLFAQRKSICEPIYEEPSTTSDLAAVDNLEVYKRQHRPRPKVSRTQSAPQLISTNTTLPVYINHSRHVSLCLSTASYSSSCSMSESLMPKSDSFSARVRGSSHIDFKTATTGVAAKAMRNELSNLVNTVKEPETKKVRPTHRIYSRSRTDFASARLSTLKCNPFSIFSLVIFRNVQRARTCTSRF